MTHVEVTTHIQNMENRKQQQSLGTGFTVQSQKSAYTSVEDVIKSLILNAHSKMRQQAKLLLRMKLVVTTSQKALHRTLPPMSAKAKITTMTQRLCCH
jgi:hypothetical protein